MTVVGARSGVAAVRPPGGRIAPTDFAFLPDGVNTENLAFASCDGAQSHGVLYQRGGERTVVCLTHPRGDFTRHYLAPALLEAGYAVFGFRHRHGGADFALVHEALLLDVAGALEMLKAERGYGEVVLLGNCGGGGPLGFYQWQAETSPPGRFTHTPAGDPLDLNAVDLPAADGLILVATPFGESSVIERGLDPSVVDETDPLSCDPALDMYDPRNGYREPPHPSVYSPEFSARYRDAQRARLSRIDAVARALIAEQRSQQDLMAAPFFASLDLADRSHIQRRARDTKPVTVYRTDASLAYCDLSIDPSKRTVGGFLTQDTLGLNYARGGLGQFRSPRAWLSAASGLTARGSLRLALPHIQVPTIIINYTADRGVYPSDAVEMHAISAAKDKRLHHVDGEHFGYPIEGAADRNPRETVGRLLASWLRERFAAR